MTVRESESIDASPNALDALLALHATAGPLPGFAEDLRANPISLTRPQCIYALGRLCERNRHALLARLLDEIAYCRGIGSPEWREGAGSFLLDQNWYPQAERELLAITRSWFAFKPTVDTAMMRLGLLYSQTGNDERAAEYLARALPGLQQRSVWIGMQRGERRVYGQGAENFLWTIQHYHALRAAEARDDMNEAVEHAMEIARRKPDESNFAIEAVPVLKSHGHPAEVRVLFDAAYQAAKRKLAEAPADPQRLNEVAWLCAVCDEHLDEAQALAERAIAAAPADANLIDTLAEILFHRGDVAGAIKQERCAVEMNPEREYLKKQLEKFEKAGG
jgi:tetratricopeptide (TPR) repeat protein